MEFERERKWQQGDLEADEVEFDWASLTLDEALLECAERGDTVRLEVGGRSWSGPLVHVGEDLATLGLASGVEIDVAIGRVVAVRVTERNRGGGRPIRGHPRRLEARLRELVVSQETVELGVGEGLRGRVSVVAVDHLRFEDDDGAEWLVPLGSVAWVIRQS
ncbi:MAG: hypothetical protein GY745_00200 [Actinomycetia bacterium]|nr:hypothetical protein [Actinomycetes bacterium]MCP4083468.1 hypothetical protein [Actinomycetes bacterium]